MPRITTVTVTYRSKAETESIRRGRAGSIPVWEQAQAIRRAAAETTNPRLLVCLEEAQPAQAWLQAAQKLLYSSTEVACVTGSGEEVGPIPTLWLDTTTMVKVPSRLRPRMPPNLN
ncbi:MAG: hypothetical protein ABIN58_12700 [candidate division WOR-3 bacterium]